MKKVTVNIDLDHKISRIEWKTAFDHAAGLAMHDEIGGIVFQIINKKDGKRNVQSFELEFQNEKEN